MENEKNGLNSWDLYINNKFLKAEDVNDEEEQEYVVIDVESKFIEDRAIVRLTLESNEIKYYFDLNVTNSSKCREHGLLPKDLVSCVITFKKVLVTNPQTKTEVDGLRIKDIRKV